MTILAKIGEMLRHPRLLGVREMIRGVDIWVHGMAARVRGTVLPGTLSVVVPAHNVSAYLPETLRALSRQNYRRLEIIVIDDGSADDSAVIARRFRWRDPRIHVAVQPHSGLSAARNRGAALARGEYLAFLDGDDLIDRHAYSDAIATLRRSASDFAVFPYRRVSGREFPPAAPWILGAHRSLHMRASLKERPDILVNAVAWDKVYRRAFWQRSKLAFPIGRLYEDQAVSTAAYAAADRFDILPRVSISWRVRQDGSSITQRAASVRNLTDQLAAVDDSLDVLARHGQFRARAERVVQYLHNNLVEFYEALPNMDHQAWQTLRALVSRLRDELDPLMADEVDARAKVMGALVAANDRAAAEAFLRSSAWGEGARRPRKTEGGRYEIALGDELSWLERLVVLPPRALQLSRREVEALQAPGPTALVPPRHGDFPPDEEQAPR